MLWTLEMELVWTARCWKCKIHTGLQRLCEKKGIKYLLIFHLDYIDGIKLWVYSVKKNVQQIAVTFLLEQGSHYPIQAVLDSQCSSPGWPWTCNLMASDPQTLRLQICATKLSWFHLFLNLFNMVTRKLKIIHVAYVSNSQLWSTVPTSQLIIIFLRIGIKF